MTLFSQKKLVLWLQPCVWVGRQIIFSMTVVYGSRVKVGINPLHFVFWTFGMTLISKDFVVFSRFSQKPLSRECESQHVIPHATMHVTPQRYAPNFCTFITGPNAYMMIIFKNDSQHIGRCENRARWLWPPPSGRPGSVDNRTQTPVFCI